MKKEYWLASALLVGMAACSNDETGNATGNATTGDADTALFTGSIEAPHTRAFDQTWENGDAIGISGTTGDKTYTNIRYNYADAGDGTFTAASEKICYQDGESVTFTAYYPWGESLTASSTITADTWGQADQKTFDFLFAQADGQKDVKVNFDFTHRMSKLVLTVKAGADMTYDDVKDAVCYLENFVHDGTFDRTTGTATATGTPCVLWAFANNTADGEASFNTPTISENEAESSVSYTLILFPQSFPSSAGNLSFAAETGGNTYSAEIDLSKVTGNDNANELKAGAQNNITVNLNKTGLTVGESTISAWEEMNYEVDANM